MERSGEAAYLLIYRKVLKQIRKGRYAMDEPIPSENELAHTHQVSRMTARKSIDLLVSEGYLYRRQGKGTFLTGRVKAEKEAFSLRRRREALGERIFDEILTLDVAQKVPQVFSKEQRPLLHLVRVRSVNDRPALWEEAWFLANPKAPNAPEDLRSLTAYLEQQSPLGSLYRRCEAAPSLKKKVAKALGVDNKVQALKVYCLMKWLDDTVCLYSKSIQLTEVLPFEAQSLR
ncbi:Beta-hexosaminidase [Clostridiaceae bacterium JG1575]|nr:Beta-hexosaminidase [Clostridiaceae bacterium JG1575]